MERRNSIRTVQKAFQAGKKLTMVTAYDAPSAKLVDAAGVEMILVGDSVGTTVQGRSDTLGVDMSEMLYHTEIVARCSRKALIIGDMPFGSYQASKDEAVSNAVKFLKAGANAVKLEGGAAVSVLINRMASSGIPVMGHLGYTPQSTNQTSGPRISKGTEQLLADARELQSAGVFAIVLEMVPSEVAAHITQEVEVPTIGIGAGPNCGGQVLVFHDLLGFNPEFNPKFLKRYLDFHGQALAALKEFKQEVQDGTFPTDDHSY